MTIPLRASPQGQTRTRSGTPSQAASAISPVPWHGLGVSSYRQKFGTFQALARDEQIHDAAMIAAMCAAEEGGMAEEQFVEAARKAYVSYAHARGCARHPRHTNSCLRRCCLRGSWPSDQTHPRGLSFA
jgi:hypothetical protein